MKKRKTAALFAALLITTLLIGCDSPMTGSGGFNLPSNGNGGGTGPSGKNPGASGSGNIRVNIGLKSSTSSRLILPTAIPAAEFLLIFDDSFTHHYDWLTPTNRNTSYDGDGISHIDSSDIKLDAGNFSLEVYALKNRDIRPAINDSASAADKHDAYKAAIMPHVIAYGSTKDEINKDRNGVNGIVTIDPSQGYYAGVFEVQLQWLDKGWFDVNSLSDILEMTSGTGTFIYNIDLSKLDSLTADYMMQHTSPNMSNISVLNTLFTGRSLDQKNVFDLDTGNYDVIVTLIDLVNTTVFFRQTLWIYKNLTSVYNLEVNPGYFREYRPGDFLTVIVMPKDLYNPLSVRGQFYTPSYSEHNIAVDPLTGSITFTDAGQWAQLNVKGSYFSDNGVEPVYIGIPPYKWYISQGNDHIEETTDFMRYEWDNYDRKPDDRYGPSGYLDNINRDQYFEIRRSDFEDGEKFYEGGTPNGIYTFFVESYDHYMTSFTVTILDRP